MKQSVYLCAHGGRGMDSYGPGQIRITPSGCVAQGFTLVELLTVTAIIALLVTLMLPTLGNARDQARAAACGHGIRQVMVMNTSYAADFDGDMLQGCSSGRVSPTSDYTMDYWHAILEREGYYGERPKKYHCPSMRKGTYSVMVMRYTTPMQGERESFPYGHHNKSPYRYRTIRVGALESPITYAYIGDGVHQAGGSVGPFDPDHIHSNGGSAMHSWTAFNSGGQKHGLWLSHRETCNIGFADGHVERLGPEGLLAVGNYNPDLPDQKGIDFWWTRSGEIFNLVW